MKYRGNGAWGTGEGRRLTSAEIDQNFYDVVQRLDALEADVAAGWNPIANITSTGGAMYIHMASGTIFGPLYYPAARWNDAGNWSAGSTYYANDLVSIEGDGIYHVLLDHVADNNFDADRLIGGERVYNLLIAVPNPAAVVDVYADTLILTSAHKNAYVRCHSAVMTTVYIEAGTFNVPTEIKLRQVDVGPIAIAYGDSGTFVNVPQGCDMGSNMVGATIWLKAVGDNEWDAGGDLSTAS